MSCVTSSGLYRVNGGSVPSDCVTGRGHLDMTTGMGVPGGGWQQGWQRRDSSHYPRGVVT